MVLGKTLKLKLSDIFAQVKNRTATQPCPCEFFAHAKKVLLKRGYVLELIDTLGLPNIRNSNTILDLEKIIYFFYIPTMRPLDL